MKEKYTQLQTRMTKLVLFAVLLAFCLVFCVVLYTTYTNTRNQEIDNQIHQLDKAASQIQTLQNTTTNLIKQVMYDDFIQETVIREEDPVGYYLYSKRYSSERLARYSRIFDVVQEIMIYTADDKTFSSREIKDPFKPEKHTWYSDFISSGKTEGFSTVHLSEANQDGYREEVISYIADYYSVEKTGRVLGKIVVSLTFEDLKEMASLETSLSEGYCLFNGDGVALTQEGDFDLTYDEILSSDKTGLYSFVGNVYLINRNLSDDWILVSMISGSKLMKQAAGLCISLTLVFAIVMIILFIILRLLIRNIVKPINQLSDAAMEVGNGNFSVHVDIQTHDELQLLAGVFNNMVMNIQSLMHQSVEHEKNVRLMQIENLMLQINPHFIYNTLNSIVYMARIEGNRQIADFTNSFISLLQGTLRVSNSIYCTVRSELQNIEHYLALQKYRYEDKFTYEIHCPDELLDCQILNLLIQPMVENAIFHGIAPKEEPGLLEIHIRRKGETLEICIKDDGVGMTLEQIERELTSEVVKRGGIRKIGVSNVRDRIHVFYGAPYDLTIESEPNAGTSILMTVPYEIDAKQLSE